MTTSEEPTNPGTRNPMQKYTIPLLVAVLAGGGGAGGFFSSQALGERMEDDMAEIKSEVKAIGRQLANGDTRVSVMERDMSDLRGDLEELKMAIAELRKVRR